MLLLEPNESIENLFADVDLILLQLLTFDHLQHRFALRAHHRVSAKGVEVNALAPGRSRSVAWSRPPQRTAVADPFGHRHNVRNDPLRFESPEMRAGAAKAGLHFIGDTNAAGGADVFVDVFEIAVGKNDGAADALDRFGNEGRNLSGCCVVDQRP